MFMKQLLIAICLVLLPQVVNAQEIDKTVWKDYSAAFVVFNQTTGVTSNIDPVRSAQRLSPCSTFKIYNTLIGLRLGLISAADEPWYKWDGVHRAIEGWNRDLTLREAFRVSAVPAYQMLARKIGIERMKEYIDKIGYGSKDTSAGIDVFWLPRAETASIMISADEQVRLLTRLLDSELPFTQKNIEILRDIMRVEKTEKGTLYGKTGSGMGPDGKRNLGWFVGFLEHDGSTYVFACNILEGDNPSGIVAKKMVQDIFRSQGLL